MTQPELGIMDEKYFTPRQVAEKFEVTADTIRVWTRTGKLRAIKLGTKTRIPESAVEELAREMYGE